MYFVGKRNVKKYNIKDPRNDLYAAVDTVCYTTLLCVYALLLLTRRVCAVQWMNEGVTAARPFHGGAEPDLADVTVFGALRSLAGFRVGSELNDKMKDTRYAQWYSAMAQRTGPSLRTNPLPKPTAFCETAPTAKAEEA
jgi:microsomal prostaglandin-E synthase 2